ncbi:MAG: AAA family ATPase [Bacteroidales bacterium]|nr:AAA family ATPase [Bacteroidales bacterium]
MKEADFQENERLQLAFDYVYYTGRNVFLTGKAGTGKTTFLKKLRKTCPKRMVVTSPTGVAAVNAGGVTLHSFFQLPFGPRTPDSPLDHKQGLNNRKISVIKTLELLVIDEISMVRADLLDSVDQVLRRYRRSNKPFGGVQLLLIGDMQQLSPVIRPEDEEILRPYYDSYYFFGSIAWRKTSYVCIELDHVFRQTDLAFVSLLNNIREGRVDTNTINALNSRYMPNYQPPNGEDIVTLVTTNRQADSINHTHMLALETEQKEYSAQIKGEFPESSYPVEKNLILKKDAVVMFLKNDTSFDHLFYNGKIGRVTGFDDDGVYVRCNGEDGDIHVGAMVWENTKYDINPETKEIKESVIGTFTQIPLRIAWAVTIHKSQGLTFDRLMIDASNSFAHGQVYVALSRCRTLEGLVLLRPLSAADVISDPQVRSFAEMVEQNMPNQSVLCADKREYFFDIVAEMFDFNALYNDIQTMQRLLLLYSSSVIGNKEAFNGLESIVMMQLMAVSEKFMNTIRYNYRETADVEHETTLLQRIQKGCAYYVEKMQTLLEEPIKTFAFDSDDKTKKAKLLDTYQSLTNNFDLKKNILLGLKDGFSIKKYLTRKAEISLELSKEIGGGKSTLSRVQPNASSVTSKYISNNPELYNELVQWRKDKADNLNVKSTDVVATKTLLEISNKKPTTVKDLMSITGMKGKGKPYIAEIMKILLPHVGNMNSPLFDANAEMKEAEYESLSTAEKSYYLYNNGKTVAQIASERKLTAATIMGHLADYVAKGEVDPFRIMKKDVIERIKMYILENPNSTDKSVLEGVSGGCTYGEIKVVRALMESNLYDS